MIVCKTFSIGAFACNCSVIYDEDIREALIVDPGNDILELKQHLESLNLSKISHILHTHAHFDHCGQSSVLNAETQAPLWFHDGDRFLYENLKLQGQFFGFSVAEPIPISHLLEDEQSFFLKSKSGNTIFSLKVLHTPGHTPGSCCFYTESLGDFPIVFTGDTLFAGSVGRSDLPGGNHSQLLNSIRKRLCILPEQTLCFPGHGVSTAIFQEKKSNPFLR